MNQQQGQVQIRIDPANQDFDAEVDGLCASIKGLKHVSAGCGIHLHLLCSYRVENLAQCLVLCSACCHPLICSGPSVRSQLTRAIDEERRLGGEEVNALVRTHSHLGTNDETKQGQTDGTRRCPWRCAWQYMV